MKKNIIKEEIDKYIHEQENTNNKTFQFKQKISDAHFINYDDIAPDPSGVEGSNIIVNWSATFWLDTFGIENFVPSIQNVEGNVTIAKYDEGSGDIVDQNEYNINDFEWKFDIDEANAILKMNGGFYIQAVEFDFENKLCVISF